MLTSHWGIGIGLGYTGSVSKSESEDGAGEVTIQKTTDGLFFTEPQVRYYLSCSDRFYCYGMGGFTFGSGVSKSTYEAPGISTESKSSKIQMGTTIQPGFAYLLHEKIALDLRYGALFFNTYITDPDDSDENFIENEFGLSLNPNTLSIGIQLLINCGDETER